MPRILALLLLAVCCCGAALAQDRQPVPPLAARVTDLTQTLTAEQRDGLEAKLAEFEHGKGAQVAILVVPTVQPESIEEYAVRVMETWKLGRKDINDGVLLAVAKADRKLRIEVGYGLEGALNDATAKRIVSDVIAPRFKQDDFFGGLDAGVDAILAVASGEALPEPTQNDDDAITIMLVFLAPALLLLSFFAGRMLRERLGRLASASINAGATGGIAWIFFFTVGMGLAALAIAAAAFALTWFFGMPSARRSSWLPAGSAPAFDDDSSWSRSRSRSSDSDSSSSDSDSFSGGGGESGGGGASGDW